ncbi:hypothetical protein EDB84DRAFT_1486519 [Lactarius hengduanensis]|nr:hypothetical protein EDB84DRAFT_1486519 [Lactarius hengduanensis]
MLSYGSVAVALVQRRVMVVQGKEPAGRLPSSPSILIFPPRLSASRPHDESERYLDVYTFTPSSERMFLVSDAPCARIDSNDLLTVFDDDDALAIPHDVLELPQKAYDEFSELSSRKNRRFDAVWSAWKGKFR